MRSRRLRGLVGALGSLAVALATAIGVAARRGPPATPTVSRVATATVHAGRAPAPLLVAAAYPSRHAALIIGDAGLGPNPTGFGCAATEGLACPDHGFILAAAGGRGPWRLVYRGTTGLYGLTAWAQGGAVAWGPAILLRSTDGATWHRLALPGPGTLQSVSFASVSDGWVLLLDGGSMPNFEYEGLYATRDGGRTWTQIARTAGYPRRSAGAKVIQMFQISAGYLGGGHGWVSGDGLTLFTTNNDGRTWSTAPASAQPPPNTAPVAYSLRPGNVGRFATVTQVFRTADGGRTWQAVGQIGEVVPSVQPGPGGGLWAVGIPSDDEDRMQGEPRWACPPTTPFCGAAVWSSASGGRDWTEHPMPELEPSAVAPLDARAALVVATAPDGRSGVLYTGDGGATWATSYVAPNAPAPGPTRLLGFWNALDGWGTGLPGNRNALLKTADGGRTWRRTGTLPVGTWDAAFAAPGIGWAVTANGTVKTTDGGRTWHPVPGMLRTATDAYVAVGARGVISAFPPGGSSAAAVSSDGGSRWIRFPVPLGTASLRVPSPRTAWAVQTYYPGPAPPGPVRIPAPPPHERLIWSGDGGAHWRTVLRFGQNSATLMAAPAARVLWVVLQTPAGWYLYRTDDGGAHWTVRPLPAALGYGESLSAAGTDSAWLLGPTGLWRTTDGGASWNRVSAP